MKIKTFTLILGIFLIGLASAGLVVYISNAISGSGSINGPIFYLDGSVIPISSGNPNLIYYNLSINTIPVTDSISYLQGSDRLLFISSPLGITNFYKSNFSIYIWSRTNQTINKLNFNVTKIHSDLSEEFICSASIQPNNGSSFTERTASCVSAGGILLNQNDRIGLEIFGAGTSGYWIRTGHDYNDGYSRIELILAT